MNIIEGIFVSDEMQSCGIGKLLLDYIKDKKERLQLNVYQKNARAISVGHFLRTVHTCYPFLFSAPAFALV